MYNNILVNTRREDGDDFFDSVFNYSAKVPSVDIKENPTEYIIEADLPGYNENDIKISLRANILSIKYNKSKNNTEEDRNHHFVKRERFRESFTRSFSLPEGCDEDKITANYNNGVLKIVVPKAPEKVVKNIQININK